MDMYRLREYCGQADILYGGKYRLHYAKVNKLGKNEFELAPIIKINESHL